MGLSRRGPSHRFGVAALAVLAGLAYASPARPQAAETAKSLSRQGDRHLAKVSSHLLRARELKRQGWSEARIQARLPLVRLDRQQIEIEVRLGEVTPRVLRRLEAAGLRITGVSRRWARVGGICGLESLGEIASLSEVELVSPRAGAITRSGAVTSQGDASINADDARAAWGLSGAGVKVGILSDSFALTPAVLGNGGTEGTDCDALLTGTVPQLSSDLPQQVRLLDNCDSGAGCADGQTDEGAALGEVIHDLAPGAEILFHTAFRSEADFAAGIDELVACGADVIVDDVLYFDEPMFQDGVVAQAAQQAVDAGVVYFSAAGNEGSSGVDELFVDSSVIDDEDFPISGNDLHDFGGGDRFAAITVPDGCGVRLVLQWNEPFVGALGPGSAKDLDLYLCSSASAGGCDFLNELASSANAQGCGPPGLGEPVEILEWHNDTGGPKTGYVAVDHYCGAQSDTHLRVVTFPLSCDLQSYDFETGIFDGAQIYGHPAALGANAVAAVFYDEIDSGGAAQPPLGQIDVTATSSLGGDLTFYFDGSGNPLGSPADRAKPEHAAPEGTNNTFFGVDLDGDTWPNFSGTSAAAAHAAAVAALLREANPVLTPQEIRDALGDSATDIESAGVDALSGKGLIDAHAAVLEIPIVPLLEVGPTTLAFPSQSPGTLSPRREVTIENLGRGIAPASEQAKVTAMTLSDSIHFALDVNGGGAPCGSTTPTLDSGDSCTVSVRARPQTVGVFNGVLTVSSDSAVGPSQTVALSAAGCATLTLDLTGAPEASPEVVEACQQIAAGPYAIGSGDEVTFRAGREITLREGFHVDGGLFTALIDPLLVALP